MSDSLQNGPKPQPGILDIAPYVGGEAHAIGVERLIRLASNEGAYGPSPRAVAAVQAMAGDIHRYPDGGATRLRQALGQIYGLNPDNVVCGAGSDELLGLLCRSYAGQGDEVLYSQHGFLMYPIATKAAGATPVTAPETGLRANVDALLAAVTPRTKIVFLANPNNPTGSYIPHTEVERLHAGLPSHVLLVLDAAYAEYVTEPDYNDGHGMVERHANVVVARTFSKIYALAGLRLGWVHCPPAIADVLNRARNPFNVSSVALAAGLAALEDQDFIACSRRRNAENRAWFSTEIVRLGLTVHPSVANFVLVEFNNDTSAESCRQFLKARGILVRQMGGYGLPRCLRVTIGREDEMREVVQTIAAFLKA